MICYEHNGNLVMARIIPSKKIEEFLKATRVTENSNEYFSIQCNEAIEDYQNNRKPARLEIELLETLNKSKCFRRKTSGRDTRIDFELGYIYDMMYSENTKEHRVIQAKMLYPKITELCIKGNMNTFVHGRKKPEYDRFNLFDLINKDKAALSELREIVAGEPDYAEMVIKELWPEFAKAYYDLFPEIKLEEICSLSIKALKSSLKTDENASELLELQPIAIDNSRMLKLLNKNR